MFLEELLILIAIAVALIMYRNYQGQNVGKYIPLALIRQLPLLHIPSKWFVIKQKS